MANVIDLRHKLLDVADQAKAGMLPADPSTGTVPMSSPEDIAAIHDQLSPCLPSREHLLGAPKAGRPPQLVRALPPELAAPCDLDAEAAVLSAVMRDPAALDKVCEFLKAEHFYGEAHRRIFEACVALSGEGKPVDVVQVAGRLRTHDRLAQVGGPPYITQLLSAAPAVANVESYAKTVHERWRRRRAIELGQRLVADGYGASNDTTEALVERSQVALAALVATAAPAAKIRVLGGTELAVAIPSVPCLVSEIGLVAGGGATHLVAGYGFSGKTLALQSLALSLAAGHPVWGAYSGSQGRVLHVDLEQGDRLTRRRYQRLAAAMGVELPSLDGSLGLVVLPALKLVRDDVVRWRDLMHGRDLVIVDSLRAASGGQDENSSEIRGCLDLLGELSEATQCRALLIHHSRKPQKDDPGSRFAIRGSSAIYDACDCVYLFSSAKGEPVSVEQAKARTHGESIPDFALSITDVEIDGDPRAGLRVQVHGHELVEERRHQREEGAHQAQARRDAETVRVAIARSAGIGTRELRGVTRLSGDRIAAALMALGTGVEVREERRTATGPMSRCHYLQRSP